MNRNKYLFEIGEIWYDHAGNECYLREDGTMSVRTVNDEESMAIQSEADKLDLNIIKAIYDRTGVMNNVRREVPRYGDFTESMDYHDMVLRVQQAQDDFMTLDAHTRARFDNDPGKLLAYVRDPKNRSEAIELGLIEAPTASPQASQVPQGESVPPAKAGV